MAFLLSPFMVLMLSHKEAKADGLRPAPLHILYYVGLVYVMLCRFPAYNLWVGSHTLVSGVSIFDLIMQSNCSVYF